MDLVVHVGPWYCPSCGRTCDATVQTRDGLPACPSCGANVEPQGTGDDDPEGSS